MSLVQKRKPLRPAFRQRITLKVAEASVAVAFATAVLVLMTVSLGVYIEYAGLLTWIFVGSAVATFVYQLGRYMHAVGRRTVRPDVRMVWRRTARVWRIFLVVCVVWGAMVITIGGHVTFETPTVRAGRYVTTRYGHVVRYTSRAEFRDLKMGRFRLFTGIAGIFVVIGATIAAARDSVETPGGSPLGSFGT
jgi:hypothetical protein